MMSKFRKIKTSNELEDELKEIFNVSDSYDELRELIAFSIEYN